ncbi:Na-translocating system protein MpsC family protein [Halalkalibacter akibai]|uniref:Na+-translocating membrane potential-generating system MpsC domain-containing protein n=1 Tax=Halalkalibacter akibai (strain ATCC 43226 / DSM 21942 / CIP 109018 / JCM 9157 / 1139) TaxID=1236973 RepID=W4QY91_HALA3|nr:Na-translocating system protein MpsC family protein [Halalkalibacter akibai]GAE37051.1 hypothetical protein JCM9157_4294 [Halalkalibacter akibai JCM 9157]
MIREGKQDQDLTHLSSYISKVLKLKFGKGPETCMAAMGNNLLIVRVHHFMTPTEKVLYEENEVGLALRVRTILMETIFKEISEDVAMLIGLKFTSFYHDWDYKTNQGILLFMAGDSFEHGDWLKNEGYELALCEKVQSVCGNVHKKPSIVNIIKVSPNLCVVECLDVLIKTEHLLHSGGYHDILSERSYEIRENFTRYKSEFQSILNMNITQMFLVWDYNKNKSFLVFCMK